MVLPAAASFLAAEKAALFLAALRKQFPELVEGDISVFPFDGASGEDGMLACRRGDVLVVLNAGSTEQKLNLPVETLLYSNGLMQQTVEGTSCSIAAKTLQVYRLR